VKVESRVYRGRSDFVKRLCEYREAVTLLSYGASTSKIGEETCGGETAEAELRARVRGSTLELLEQPSVMLRDGEEVTITISGRSWKPDLDALRSSFGGWKGLVDTDALLRDIYASRAIRSRKPAPRF